MKTKDRKYIYYPSISAVNDVLPSGIIVKYTLFCCHPKIADKSLNARNPVSLLLNKHLDSKHMSYSFCSRIKDRFTIKIIVVRLP